MKSCMTNKYNGGYVLSLPDENRWLITADEGLFCWLNKLATIMELEPSRMYGLPNLIFTEMREGNGAKGKRISERLSIKNANGSQGGWIFYGQKTLHLRCHKSLPEVICEVDNKRGAGIEYINMWTALQPIYQGSIDNGGLPLHAGLAELAGEGILLAASGDGGKSTCCRRLPEYWIPWCDDETLIVLSKEKKYLVHPFPTWNDYIFKRREMTWNVQYSVPLAALFFLERSETDKVLPIGEGEAVALMNASANQVYRKFWGRTSERDQRKCRENIFKNTCDIAKAIPSFILRVSINGRFWEKIEKVLA